MSLRRIAFGVLVSGLVAAFATAADKPASSEKRFALPSGESMVMKWTAGFADLAAPPGAPDGSVAFSGPDASKMRVMLVPMPPNPNFTGDIGNLRIIARNMARELEEAGGNVNQDQIAVDGPNVRGLYVKGVDPKPKPGEFTYICAGPLVISSRPYVFEVLWNTGGETAANNALAALKTLRIQ